MSYQSNGNHLIRQPKPRTGKTGGTKWWDITAERQACKYRALELVRQHVPEETLSAGRGIWPAVRSIFPQIAVEFPHIFEEYRKDRGRDLTWETLAQRVHKMYYSYKPKEGLKCHGKSSEHPEIRRG